MGASIIDERRSAAEEAGAAFSWPKPEALVGVKSKKRAILWLRSLGAKAGKADVGSLTLTSRAVLHGLTTEEATDLACDLARAAPLDDDAAQDAGRQWAVQRHEECKVAVLSQAEEDPLVAVAAEMPHVLVLLASGVRLSSPQRAALAAYPGALLVLADAETQDVDALLASLGASEKWCLAAKQVFLPSLLDEVLAGEDEAGPTFLHDVRLRAPSSPQQYCKPWLGELLEEQLAPLYLDEFGADLGNLCQSQRGYGIKLSLMLEKNPEEETPNLLGFLAYKPWGAPRPGVSVCAVGVNPRCRGKGYGRDLMRVAEAEAARAGEHGAPGVVSFRSLYTAVGFYNRLGYRRTEEGEQMPEPPEDCDPDDLPCVPMERGCDPALAQAAPSTRYPLQAWSPRRSRHLEDGPTWLPAEAFELPAAEAGS